MGLGCSLVVDFVLSVHEALSSVFSTSLKVDLLMSLQRQFPEILPNEDHVAPSVSAPNAHAYPPSRDAENWTCLLYQWRVSAA